MVAVEVERDLERQTEWRKMLDVFMITTEYNSSDVLSVNYHTRTIMTRNGGIYTVDTHYHVRWVKGPPVLLEDRG